MDMKKILQAVDKADSASSVNSADMKKFVSIINESNNRLTQAEQLVYQTSSTKKSTKVESWISPYITLVESEIAEKKSLSEGKGDQ
jgi:hypothetical protein